MNATKILVVAVLLVSSFAEAQVVKVTPKSMLPNNPNTTYYYLPEVESYYDVKNKKYIYAKDSKWFTASTLPAKHKAYNITTSRKVALTDKSAPYRNFSTHKSKFFKSTEKKKVVRPGNSGNAPGHNKKKHHNHEHGKGHGHNDSKHGGKHNKK